VTSFGNLGRTVAILVISWKKLTIWPLEPRIPFFMWITGISGDTHWINSFSAIDKFDSSLGTWYIIFPFSVYVGRALFSWVYINLLWDLLHLKHKSFVMCSPTLLWWQFIQNPTFKLNILDSNWNVSEQKVENFSCGVTSLIFWTCSCHVRWV